MLAILTHTPLWVFVLFFALLVFGYAQSRDRRIHRPGVSIPPTIMCALSCYGVISAFGANVACLLVWVGSLALGVLISLMIWLRCTNLLKLSLLLIKSR